jgi:outer membrane autotransporter protein
VELSVDVKSFSTAACNPVEGAIAGYMDACMSGATGDMAQMIGAFQLSSPDQVAEGFATLSPDTYDNLTRGALQSARLTQEALVQRMDAARSNPFPGRETPGRMAYEGGNGAWLSGVRQGADQDAGSGYLAHNFTTSGALGGYERSLGTSIVGLSFGTTTTDVDRDNDMAKGSCDGIGGSAYGGLLWGRMFAHGVVSYAHESFDNRRDVHVGPLTRVARSEHNGSALSALLTGGRRFDAGRFGLEPFASVRFARLSEDGFTEKGAESVNLVVESRATNQLGSDVGVRLSRSFVGERSAWIPELVLSWNHDFGLDDRPVTAAFEGDPSMTFTFDGQDVQRDGGSLGAGLSYLTTSGWKASVRYDRLQRSDYRANSLTIRVGSAF